MLGGIYSDQKCPICGGGFVDNHRDGLTCPKHPKMRAARHIAKFGKLFKRFKEYDQAQRFLTGVRFKTDENTYDVRDYKQDNPLGFTNMSNKWMGYHLDTVRPGSRKNIKSHLRHAQNFFLDRNVKDLRYGDFEDFIQTLTLSDKTKHNILSTVHHFYTWMKRRQEIASLPDFPVISFELGYRRTVDKGTQHAIIEEVKRICGNRRVYLGIKWLATYISVRPGEMIRLKEKDIDMGNGYLYFPHPKERKFKSVPILPEDIEILKSFTLSFPAMPFFRHDGGLQGVADGQPFGEKYFYKWWVKACSNLGIEGVDLYGGTRHSSVRALRRYRTPEEIKEATMSATNKAFERYMGQANDGDILSIYKQSAEVIPISAPDTALIPQKMT
ncbi:MAG: hypothetical protein V1766_04360 [Pseudomonadota bacterium]